MIEKDIKEGDISKVKDILERIQEFIPEYSHKLIKSKKGREAEIVYKNKYIVAVNRSGCIPQIKIIKTVGIKVISNQI